MTISLIVFVSLQFYWLKEYYASLEQEFSNKVHIALENSAQKISEIEFNKYNEKFKNFDQTLTSNAKKPTLFTVQQTQDSLSKTTLSFGKTIVEKQDIPISKKEIVLPSLNSTKMKVFIVQKNLLLLRLLLLHKAKT
jgi:two-component system phosphate regulon sensor histidine kinase PhoR